MGKRHRLVAVAIACLTAVFVEPAAAQVLTGSLFGTLKDPSGAVMPGITVTVTSDALIAGSAAATTRPDGTYRFPVLPPGDYALAVDATGFAKFRDAGIRVGVEGAVERT